MSTDHRPSGLSLWDAAAFIDELGLLAVLALGGASLPVARVLRVGFAIALPAAVAVGWRLVLAPRAPHRLAGATGFVVKAAVYTGACLLLSATRSMLFAVVFWSLSMAIWATVEVRTRRNAPATPTRTAR